VRVLIPEGSGRPGARVNLEESEVHHLRVRRARDQQSVEVLDGSGLRGSGLLVRAGREWLVEVQTVERQERPPEMTLAAGGGDRERFSWMVEKAVELGVTSIVPLETERSLAVATRLKANHVERLRRVVLESIKQCGVAWAPRVEKPIPLEDFLQRSLFGAGWLADIQGAPVPAVLDQDPLTVVIGPEGGLTNDERSAVVAAGYQPMLLGFHTLRFETAALAAAAAVTQARIRGEHG
jgi:16S rRNA (uracil1498-N3)-methyltransferase